MTRAHLVPESLGGFVWARTLCAACNNGLGTRVEAGVKKDPTIRYALEHALADKLPELAQKFAEGQSYVVPSEQGPLEARYRGGGVELGTTKFNDGSLVQARDRAAQTVETMLERAGANAEERREALERIEAAEVGELLDLGRGVAIRHGTTEGASITFDGQRVSDEFPLAIAFHLLAFFIGSLIYSDALEPIRSTLRSEQTLDPEEVQVESLIDRSTDYVPQHVLGLSRAEPHIVIRVQLFGPPVWNVHLLRVKAPRLAPMGMMLDVAQRNVYPAEPARRTLTRDRRRAARMSATVYDRERTAHHEAGHATARYVVYGRTGATTIRLRGDTWGSSEAERLPDGMMAGGNVRWGPYSRVEERLLSKAILCAICGSAAEACFLKKPSADSTWAIFLTKADDQEFVWELAGKRWAGNPSRRDRMVELLARVAVRLVLRNGGRVDRVAAALLLRTDLSAADVAALM